VARRYQAERPRIGGPVVLQGRNLSGRGVPKMPLRRDQWSDWFVVLPDDTFTPTDDPDC
jgi:hypothetical protein